MPTVKIVEFVFVGQLPHERQQCQTNPSAWQLLAMLRRVLDARCGANAVDINGLASKLLQGAITARNSTR